MFKIKREIIDELHKPTRINYLRRKVIVKGLNETFQADLVEMIPYEKMNKSYRYILVVIDIFSKFIWTEPIKRKSGQQVTAAFRKILRSSNRIPINLHTDMGTEFYNDDFKKLMKEMSINHYSTYSNKKASIVERVNRTLKNLMWKEFSLQGTYKWLEILPKITYAYNNKKHSTIKMKPVNVTEKNEKHLLNTVYNRIKIVPKYLSKFKIGDNVRISKERGVFSKGYQPNWSTEIFVIKQVKLTNPITCILNDKLDQPIKGAFYENELQKVKYDDVYLVEKILKKKGNKLFVKWLGFDSTFNSWIDNKSNL